MGCDKNLASFSRLLARLSLTTASASGLVRRRPRPNVGRSISERTRLKCEATQFPSPVCAHVLQMNRQKMRGRRGTTRAIAAQIRCKPVGISLVYAMTERRRAGPRFFSVRAQRHERSFPDAAPAARRPVSYASPDDRVQESSPPVNHQEDADSERREVGADQVLRPCNPAESLDTDPARQETGADNSAGRAHDADLEDLLGSMKRRRCI
jgi:hypothetical protein